MDLKNVASLSFFYPELILSGTILLLIVLDLLARAKRDGVLLGLVALIGCTATLAMTR